MTMTKHFNKVQSESRKGAAAMKKMVTMTTSNHASDACYAPAACAASVKMETVGILGTAVAAVFFLSDVLLGLVSLAVRIMLPRNTANP